MKNNELYKLGVLLGFLLLLTLTGCGGGSGATDKASFGAVSAIVIVDCNPAAPIFTPLQSGDVIISQTADTQVQIRHDQNDEKEVCTIQGRALINR